MNPQQKLNFAIQTLAQYQLQAALEEIPGVGEIVLAGMITDMVDPYDYSSTYTKSGISAVSQVMFKTLNEKLKDPQLSKKLFLEICNKYQCDTPGSKVTSDQVRKLINILTNYWQIQNVPVNTDCYGDFDASGTLTGKPKGTCDQFYTDTYNNYYNNNIKNYLRENYEGEKALYEGIIKIQIDDYRNNVLRISGFILFILFILFLIFIFVYFKFIKK